MQLSRTRIARNLNCEGAALVAGDDGVALAAEDAAIEGSAYLRAQLDRTGGLVHGFESRGTLRFYRAKIKGNLDCQGATLVNPGDVALHVEDAVVDGTLFIRNRLYRQQLRRRFTAQQGTVRLYHTTVGGSVEADGALLDGTGTSVALDGVLLDVKGILLFRRGFTAKGELRLTRAHIQNLVDCTGAMFENPEGNALTAEELVTGNSVLLRSRERDGVLERFVATGLVQLYGARIGRNLDCQGGRFLNPGRTAIRAEDVEVGGSIIFNHTYRHPELKFTARGTVVLFRARVDRSLNMQGVLLESPEPNRATLDATGLEANGDVLLIDGFTARGTVLLNGAQIGGALRYGPAEVEALALEHAHAGRLIDDEQSWRQSRLYLDGFEYDGLGGGAPTKVEVRRLWCERQPGFRPQPYEQLARTLRQMGHEGEAR